MARLARFSWIAGVVLLNLLAGATAQAKPPTTSTFSFPFTKDVFRTADNPHCSFPVIGSWDVTVKETDFLDERTGVPTMSLLEVHFVGTLSNPLSGKSIPDSDHHWLMKLYFDSGGNLIRVAETQSRDDPYFRLAFHEVSAPDGTVLKDVGRDVLLENKHPLDIAPLCAVLS
jgi:hypothetical protein